MAPHCPKSQTPRGPRQRPPQSLFSLPSQPSVLLFPDQNLLPQTKLSNLISLRHAIVIQACEEAISDSVKNLSSPDDFKIVVKQKC